MLRTLLLLKFFTVSYKTVKKRCGQKMLFVILYITLPQTSTSNVPNLFALRKSCGMSYAGCRSMLRSGHKH